jgi:hypothetical protein
MTATPKGWPGETTEQVMWRVRSTMEGRKLPALDTRTYNAVYECVFEVLHREYTRPGFAGPNAELTGRPLADGPGSAKG